MPQAAGLRQGCTFVDLAHPVLLGSWIPSLMLQTSSWEVMLVGTCTNRAPVRGLPDFVVERTRGSPFVPSSSSHRPSAPSRLFYPARPSSLSADRTSRAPSDFFSVRSGSDHFVHRALTMLSCTPLFLALFPLLPLINLSNGHTIGTNGRLFRREGE